MDMATMQYMNVKTASVKWGLTERRVRILCSEGRVDGVIRNGWGWNIPYDAPKPQDGRRLRHIKNIALRPGSANYTELDGLQKTLSAQKDDRGYVLRTFRSLLPDFLSGAFAFDGVLLPASAFAALFQGESPVGITQENMLLSFNTRTILMRCMQETGLGPVEPMPHDVPYLSEVKLRKIYRDLLSGVDDLSLAEYRKASIPAGGADDCKVFSISQQMAILMYQYDKEWQMLHPLVRASFLFGELMRIRPFGKYDGLFALIILGCELLGGGYPIPVLTAERMPELRADLSLTQKRGNYQDLIALFETSLVDVLKLLLREKG